MLNIKIPLLCDFKNRCIYFFAILRSPCIRKPLIRNCFYCQYRSPMPYKYFNIDLGAIIWIGYNEVLTMREWLLTGRQFDVKIWIRPYIAVCISKGLNCKSQEDTKFRLYFVCICIWFMSDGLMCVCVCAEWTRWCFWLLTPQGARRDFCQEAGITYLSLDVCSLRLYNKYSSSLCVFVCLWPVSVCDLLWV